MNDVAEIGPAVASAVADLEALTLSVTEGPPCESDFVTYRPTASDGRRFA